MKTNMKYLTNTIGNIISIDSELYNKFSTIKEDSTNLTYKEQLSIQTYLGFANALYNNNLAIQSLLDNNDFKSIHHPIGLLVRNNLTISFRILYLSLQAFKSDDAGFYKEIFALNFDFFERLKSHLRVLKATGHPDLNKSSVNEKLNEIIDSNEEYRLIVSTAQKSKNYRTPVISTIYKDLALQGDLKKDLRLYEFRNIAGIYEVWEYYSKFEHLTGVFYEVRKNESLQKGIDRILRSYELVSLVSYLISLLINQKTQAKKYLSLYKELRTDY